VNGPSTSRTEAQLVALVTLVAIGVMAAIFFGRPGLFGRDKISGDGWDNYAITHSLLFDQDLDLANQFSHCCNQWGHAASPLTKKVPSPHPIGTPLLWLPELALTHAVVWPLSHWVDGLERQGYSTVYFVGAAFGSVVNGSLGLLLIYLFLRRRVGWPAALLATISMLLATPLFFFMVFHPSYSHAQDLLVVAFFVWFWDRSRGQLTVRRWAALGALAGLVALVREQYVLVALVAVTDVVGHLLDRSSLVPFGKRLARCALLGAVATGCAVLAFAPQLITWKYWYGSFVTVPQGDWYMQWSKFTVENLLNILFWSKNGLASWHPIYWLAGLGLVVALRREWRVALPLVLVLLAELYVAAVCRDLWAGWSFGHRRLLGAAICFALGLGHLFELLARSAQRRHWTLALAVVAVVVAPFAALNIDMMKRLFDGKLRVASVQPMAPVYRLGNAAWAKKLWHVIGNPIGAPAVWYDRVRFGLRPEYFDTMAGEYFLYRFEPEYKPNSFRIGFEGEPIRNHVIEGEIAPVEGRKQLLAQRQHDRLDLRLALPIWLVESDLWLTVRGRFVDPLHAVPAESCQTSVALTFNGERYPFVQQGCQFAVPVRIPRAAVRWGFNELRLRTRESDTWSANIAISEIDLVTRN